MSITVSVAIPCYKSAKTIGPVVEEIKKSILAREGNDYQIILVNDYPYDDTWQAISDLCRDDPKIIGVNLSRNFGQSYAKMAALEHFTGDVLVSMDDDGQHPADRIYDLVDKVMEGYDVVYAAFPQKKHSLFKRITSDMNRQLQIWNGVVPKGIHVTSYYAVSAFVANELKKYKSPYPSVGAYTHCITQKYANVEMPHRERMAGSSNYTLGKMIQLWLLVFFNFSMLPLRLSTYTGIFCAGVGFLYGVILILMRLFSRSFVAGYTSTVALLLFIGGLIMMVLGIIGEYLGRIYMTISNRPQYAVRETLNSKKN